MKTIKIVAVSRISGVFPQTRFDSFESARHALEDAGFSQAADTFGTFSLGVAVEAYTDGFNGAVGIFETE